MKSWKDLTKGQQALIALAMVITALFLPEITYLLSIGGFDLTFMLMLASLTPTLIWLASRYRAIFAKIMLTGMIFQFSASAKPSVYFTQATFCCIALALTGSAAFAFSFFMPGMLFMVSTISLSW